MTRYRIEFEIFEGKGGQLQQEGDQIIYPDNFETLGICAWMYHGDGQHSYQVGQRFKYPEDTGSLCSWLLSSMDTMIQTLRCGGILSWMHEGLAMLTVDRFFERPTIKSETIETLHRLPGNTNGPRKLNLKDPDAVVYLYVRGYWLMRYIEETRPGLLKSLLARHYRHNELENEIASAYGMERQMFWGEIDGTVAAHYNQKGS